YVVVFSTNGCVCLTPKGGKWSNLFIKIVYHFTKRESILINPFFKMDSSCLGYYPGLSCLSDQTLFQSYKKQLSYSLSIAIRRCFISLCCHFRSYFAPVVCSILS